LAGQKEIPIEPSSHTLPGRIAVYIGSVSTLSKDSVYTAPTPTTKSASGSSIQMQSENQLDTFADKVEPNMSELRSTLFESSFTQQMALEHEFWDIPMVRVK
jgi:hypothetical protein